MATVLTVSFPTINAIIDLLADEISTNPANNTSVLNCYLRSRDNTWGPVAGGVTDATGVVQRFGLPSIPGGTTQGPWPITCVHNPNGSLTAKLFIFVNSTNANDPANLGKEVFVTTTLPLTTLIRIPGTPTDPVLTWISDSELNAAWTRNESGNNAATQTALSVAHDGITDSIIVGPTSSLRIPTAPNRRTAFGVTMGNGAGWSPWSTQSNFAWTTPAPVSNVKATRSGLDIVVNFTDNTTYSERQFLIQHGTVTGGLIAWDSGNLATVAGGATAGGSFTFTHVAPTQGVMHVYRVAAQTTDANHLTSAFVQSNTAAPPTPPNIPTWASQAPVAAATKTLLVRWNHNTADSSPQSAFALRYSSNGGSTWTNVAKTASTASQYTLPAFATGTVLTVQVMTWGIATTGGSDGAGGSPWSNSLTITYRTSPVVTVTFPANNGTVTTSSLWVVLGFSQAEGARAVQAVIVLSQGGTVFDPVTTTTLPGTALPTHLDTGLTYGLQVTVTDSNGLTGTVSTSFKVLYSPPVAAIVKPTYLPDSGRTQLDVTVPVAGASEIPAKELTVTRQLFQTPPDPATVGRSNLIADPRATSTTLWPAATNSTRTIITGATDGPTLPDGTTAASYARFTYNADSVNGHGGFIPAIPAADIYPAGTLVATSLYVRSSVALNMGTRGQSRSSTNVATSFGAINYQPVPANTWTRLTAIAAVWVAGGAFYARYYVSGTIPAGAVIDVTCAMAEILSDLPVIGPNLIRDPGFATDSGTDNLTTSTAGTGAPPSTVPAFNATGFAGPIPPPAATYGRVGLNNNIYARGPLGGAEGITTSPGRRYRVSMDVAYAGTTVPGGVQSFRFTYSSRQNGTWAGAGLFGPTVPIGTTPDSQFTHYTDVITIPAGVDSFRPGFATNYSTAVSPYAEWWMTNWQVTEIPADNVYWDSLLTTNFAQGPIDDPETLVDRRPFTAGDMTIIDMTPSVHGVNIYQITTWSADETATTVTEIVVTTENMLAFINSGNQYDQQVSVWGDLTLGSSPGRQQALVDIEDADLPVSMFGTRRNLTIPVTATLIADTPAEVFKIEKQLQTAELVCYRDPTGRRIFGQYAGGIAGWKAGLAKFSFTIKESN